MEQGYFIRIADGQEFPIASRTRINARDRETADELAVRWAQHIVDGLESGTACLSTDDGSWTRMWCEHIMDGWHELTVAGEAVQVLVSAGAVECGAMQDSDGRWHYADMQVRRHGARGFAMYRPEDFGWMTLQEFEALTKEGRLIFTADFCTPFGSRGQME